MLGVGPFSPTAKDTILHLHQIILGLGHTEPSWTDRRRVHGSSGWGPTPADTPIPDLQPTPLPRGLVRKSSQQKPSKRGQTKHFGGSDRFLRNVNIRGCETDPEIRVQDDARQLESRRVKKADGRKARVVVSENTGAFRLGRPKSSNWPTETL